MSDGGEGVLTIVTKLQSWRLKWKISKNTLQILKTGDMINCRPFKLLNTSWLLFLLPDSGGIVIQLSRLSNIFEEIHVNVAFGIETAQEPVIYTIREVLKYSSGNHSIGAGFFQRESFFPSLKGFLPDGDVTIVCYITPMFDSSSEAAAPEMIDANGPTSVQNLEHLFLSKHQADVIIKVKGNEFKCHRTILLARSTVFAAMFQQNMSERNSGVVEITDCEPDHFKNFLLYLYTGKTDTVTADNAFYLYNIADKYAVDELKVKCVECMGHNLSIDSACDVLVFAEMNCEAELLQIAAEFFISNMKEVVQTEKWVNFPCAHSNLVTELFLKTSDYLNK